MIRFSLRKFPVNKDLEDATGVPWGCTLEPLITLPKECMVDDLSSSLDRCHNCYSYINCFTTVNKTHWHCMMCHTENEVTARYSNNAKHPELTQTLVEMNIPPDAEDNSIAVDPPLLPIYIGVVDITGGPDYISTVQRSLSKLVESLSDDSLFGLVVFDDRIGVYNLYCGKPHVRHVRINSGSCPINLEEMTQHDDTFVRVGDMRESINAAIENISSVALQGGNRCLATTVQSLVDFFGTYQGHTYFRENKRFLPPCSSTVCISQWTLYIWAGNTQPEKTKYIQTRTVQSHSKHFISIQKALYCIASLEIDVIQTVKIPTAEYIENMFENADPEVITKLFVHRVSNRNRPTRVNNQSELVI
eukprot:sb/3466008/